MFSKTLNFLANCRQFLRKRKHIGYFRFIVNVCDFAGNSLPAEKFIAGN
ncbi:MAG: hypothetical protein KME19_25035 [Microcoleus vaginatus WJT46-NPBG5]|nr:hypothetical protein [Microcoleus vaginatus WJT46-NPBG5]